MKRYKIKLAMVMVVTFHTMSLGPFVTGVLAAQEVVGRTYDIAEKDALEDFQDEAEKIDWQKLIQEKQEENVKKYQPKDLKKLPRATEAQTYLVDMTYELEMDIPDGKGGILYPKGYQFNPLQYMPVYSGIIVVINPTDEDQIEWFEKSEYAKNFRTRLIITDGAHLDVSKRLNRPIYYLNKIIANRFHIVEVPSVVQQNGYYMEVQVIDVEEKTDN